MELKLFTDLIDALGKGTEEKKKGTGYLNLAERPRGRSVDSSPSVVASCCCHLGVPNGWSRFTQVRRVVSSCATSG